MLTKKVSNAIQLVKDNCTPDEASKLIDSMVGDRIRLHNIQMLRRWEGDHSFDSTPFDQKIMEMKLQNKCIRALLSEANEHGLNVELSATIEVRLVKKPFTHNVKLELSHN